MIIFKVTLPFILLFLIGWTYKITGRWRNGLSIVVAWWLGWLWLSNFAIVSFSHAPGATTQLLTIGSCLAIVAAAALGSGLTRLSPHAAWRIEASELLPRWFFHAMFVVVLFIELPVLWKQAEILGPINMAVEQYKYTAFYTKGQEGFLFPSSRLQAIYFLITGPFLLLFTLQGLADVVAKRSGVILIEGMILILADSVIRLGRINLYQLLVLSGCLALLQIERWQEGLRGLARHWRFSTIAVSLVGLILVYGELRVPSDRNLVESNLVRSVLDYHTVGFFLFDQELTVPTSRLNENRHYGRLTFGGLETLATLLIRQVDRNYMSPAYENAIVQTDNVVVGRDSQGRRIQYNAYYTWLYSLYGDGGAFWVISFTFIYGWIYGAFLLSRAAPACTPAAITLELFWLSVPIFSIFISQLENTRTWLVFLMLITPLAWRQMKSRVMGT